GLAENIRREYSRGVLYACVTLLFAANTFNISADLGAMAKAVQLLAPVHFVVLVIFFALVSLALQIFTSYHVYARYLKYLTFVLFAYVATGLIVDLDWGQIFTHTLLPSLTFSKGQLILVCAILGTTISPYLFFWQSSQEVEEDIEKGEATVEEREGATAEDIKDMRIDVAAGMFISNLVMFFIVAVCAVTLYSHGVTDIRTAADAAAALRPLAGEWAFTLFAIGIIGTGLLAIPVLAGSSAYAVAEAFHWQEGLYKKWWQAYGFYGIIILSLVIALLLNFVGIDPIKALIYSAVGNGLVAPVMLFFIVRLSSNSEIMGEWKNHPLLTAFGWLVVVLMALAGIATIISFFV
ncbi:MAG: divalent metal cation transporter, partial [Candidatus Paceibacterota bacterium]